MFTFGYDPLTIVDKRQKLNPPKKWIDPLKERIIYETRKMFEEVYISKKQSPESYTSTFNAC